MAIVVTKPIVNNSQTKLLITGSSGQVFGDYGGGASLYFPSTAFVSLADSTDFDFGSGDFTIDFWFNKIANVDNATMYTKRLNGAGYTGLILVDYSTGVSVYSSSNNSSWDIASGFDTGIIIGTGLHHLEVSRVGNSIDFYLDKVKGNTLSTSATLMALTALTYIGGATSSTSVNGTYRGIRVIKGTGLGGVAMDSNPFHGAPTKPTGTVLYIKQGATPAASLDIATAKAVTHSSAYWSNRAITVAGHTTWSTTVKSPAVKAVYFDGDGDYLSTPYHADFDFSTGDWTWHGWFYPTESRNQFLLFLGNNNAHSTSALELFVDNTTNYLHVRAEDSGGAGYIFDYVTNVAVTLNAWNHIGYSREGNDFKVFLNNVQAGATQTSAASVRQPSLPFLIGCCLTNATYNTYFKGFIKNVVVEKGTALAGGGYSANPLNGTPVITANTKLLLGHGATDILFRDLATNKAITTNGGATARYTDASWSKPTIYFDGTGDYMTTPNSADFSFGLKDFTIHYWMYPTTVDANYRMMFDNYVGTGGGNGWYLGMHNDSKLTFNNVVGGASSPLMQDSVVLVANRMYHVAVTRKAGIFYLFKNGKLVDSDSGYTGTNCNSGGVQGIGCRNDGSLLFVGYASQPTIVKSQALWTSNFEPPLVHLA